MDLIAAFISMIREVNLLIVQSSAGTTRALYTIYNARSHRLGETWPSAKKSENVVHPKEQYFVAVAAKNLL